MKLEQRKSSAQCLQAEADAAVAVTRINIQWLLP